MDTPRLPDPAKAAAAMHYLEGLVGKRLPDGCADCSAYAIIRSVEDGVCVADVFHDDTCPWYTGHGGT